MSRYVIYMKNDFCVTGKEFFKDCGNEIEGHHDPDNATPFKTKKEAKKLIDQISFNDIKIMTLKAARKSYKKQPSLYRKFSKINEEVNVPYDENMSPEDVLEFYFNHRECEDRETTYEVYATYPELWDLFDYIWSVESYSSMNGNKKYITFSIFSKKDGKYKKFLKEFKLIKDKCTYIRKEYKIFSIVDHELSKYDTYYLYYKSDDDCYIAGRFNKQASGTLKEMFNLMKTRYYYE